MMLGRARHCCLLVDHTKLGMAGFFRIGDIRSVGTLIADSFPDEDLRDFFCRCGLTCVETMTGRVYGPDGK